MAIRVRRWFWGVVVFWVFTGLPIFIIGSGFSGPNPYSFGNLVRSLMPDLSSLTAFVTWLLAWVLILLPLLLVPFAVHRGNADAPPGE